ncbi:hypothetical protein LR48_Vigan11g042100 [Vigna angularis]|uniref:Uncharacterized protein n=1 Tax=Phaseolus angularis TaxID=3914 RepID=A0A0L9VR01_PHAAN|nr:hypothetical protein LR48_Vigan11g042100 [Vigna angularis]
MQGRKAPYACVARGKLKLAMVQLTIVGLSEFRRNESELLSHGEEVDPTVDHEDMGGADGMDSLFSELAGAIPGIDEAMSFAEMLK